MTTHFGEMLSNAGNSSTDSMSLVSTSTALPTSKPDDTNLETIREVKFIVWGILGIGVAILGILGNSLSIIVLQKRQMRSTTSYYLLTLAIYDNLILLATLAYFSLKALEFRQVPGMEGYSAMADKTVPVMYPICLMAQMGSIYTCVGFSVERFIAVCRPLHVANTCTRSKTLKVVVIIFVWVAVYNTPRFFHYSMHYPESEEVETVTNISVEEFLRPSSPATSGANGSYAVANWSAECTRQAVAVASSVSTSVPKESFNAVIINSSNNCSTVLLDATILASNKSVERSRPRPSLRETDFGQAYLFQHLYLVYSQLFFMFLLPFLVILVTNVGLIRAVNRSRLDRQSMSASANKENSVTIMLIAVTVVFLICQFPTIVDNMLLAIFGQIRLNTHYSYQWFYTFVSFMVEINAASNFLLYCLFGRKFRMVLLSLFGLKKRQQRVAYRSTVRKSRSNGIGPYDTEVSVV